jgi:hypothetical protein
VTAALARVDNGGGEGEVLAIEARRAARVLLPRCDSGAGTVVPRPSRWSRTAARAGGAYKARCDLRRRADLTRDPLRREVA